MQSSPAHLTDLLISSKSISELSLSFLAEGIENNKNLKKLTLSKLSLTYSKSFVSLITAIQESTTLEHLDLSENLLNDDTGSFISCLIESNTQLKYLNLEQNRFKDFSFALGLTKNKSLSYFSISQNPLDFVNITSLLEMLTINRSLQYLGIKGISFKGPAPIKENPSGLLNMNEAIVLKLANVLRYSQIVSIGVDLDQSAKIQLRELETTITKHNRTLMKIDAGLINWTQTTGPLLGIYRGLKANQWLFDRTTEIPKEIEDIIRIKTSQKKTDPESHRHSFSPVKAFSDNKGLQRDSWESKTSDTTIVETKAIKEMSFGKSALNKLLREDDSLAKYLKSMNEKIQNIEQNFTSYTVKTDLHMEKIESLVNNSRRSEDISGISTVLKDIQSRFDKFEKDKQAHELVIEDYIQRLESLRFSKDPLSSSQRSSKRLRPQSVKGQVKVKESIDLQGLQSYEGTELSIASEGPRADLLEDRVQRLECRSDKFKHKLRGTMVHFYLGKSG